MTTTAPALPADLEAGLRRLKLATVRRKAPELFQDAKAQRWAPEELLRALIEAEVAARDASMATARLKAAGFPVKKSFEEFDFSASSIPRPTLDYLASLEWVRAKENPCLVGPPGTGKSHVLVALGHAAVEAGYKVRYFARPSSSSRSIGAWPTTPSARSSNRSCALTQWSLTSSASHPSTTPAPSCCSASSPPPTSDGHSP